MTSYTGLIRKDADSDFGVDFPDFPGCISAGATLDEARHMAQEALELHIGGVLEDDEALPVPSSLEAVMAEPENADAVAFLVSVPEAADPHGAGEHNPARTAAPSDRRARQEPLRLPRPRRREGAGGELTERLVRPLPRRAMLPLDRGLMPMAHERIEINPKIMGGKPVNRSTRIPVELILRKLGAGMTSEKILADHPNLKPDDIRAAQAFAADYLADEELVYR
jgi:predicted RNase H-like HicB family nuclease/uncharacterized protein (DUF433 family)